MKANPRGLERIFDQAISYEIPLFQRPYVWTEDKNWEPLWVDIQSLLDQQLEHGRVHPHFLGAVVFEQMSNATGSIETRQVIDGQQRLTTLQLFLIAARDVCRALNSPKYMARFSDLVSNRETRIDHDNEKYKVWPTNADRADFAAAHSAGSPEVLAEKHQLNGRSRKGIPGAYRYFYGKLRDWVSGALSDGDQEPEVSEEDRLEALWQVARSRLQTVVIDLEEGDESQVIFETLNARGTQLLPADLVKNFLFHRAERSEENVEQLYEQFWRGFDSDFWREEIKHGRVRRPRIDIFLQHFLSLKTLDEVRVTHLFEAFKTYVLRYDSGERSESEISVPVGKHLEALRVYGDEFRACYEPDAGSRLAIFIDRLEAVDTVTVYPFLLEAIHTLKNHSKEELDRILTLVESFLIRRMICGLTSKNYNKLFIDLIKGSRREGRISEPALIESILQGSGDSVRFPDDAEFRNAWMNYSLYGWLAQYKIRAVLSALDAALTHCKSEQIGLPSNLQIEHVMPQEWAANWPLGLQNPDDPTEKLEATEARNSAIQTIGNLTLITESLNPALSNGAWHEKRPELLKFSKLNLTRYFHDVGDWDETAIRRRSEFLFDTAIGIWPYPQQNEA